MYQQILATFVVLQWLEPNVAWSQNNFLLTSYDSVALQPAALDTLRMFHGCQKQIPPAFEVQALLALAHYPELHDAPIILG